MKRITHLILRALVALPLLAAPAHGQTNIFLRAGGPQSQTIVGATNATPVVIQTQNPHGFSSSCNTTTNICYCGPTGVPTGAGASPVNYQHECVYVDATHLAIYDLSGNPVAGNGGWWAGYSNYPNVNPGAQWVGQLTKYTIPANPGPLGFFDGTNGDLTRRVSLRTFNGLSSVVVSGCPAACVVAVTLSYDPTVTKYPVAAGQNFSITGTGSNLDTCGAGGGAYSPYQMASVSSSGWVSTSFTCAGLSNGDYTGTNLTCGPASPPNNTIGGTVSCTSVSQMGYTGNPAWNNLLTDMARNHLTASPDYMTTFDGGVISPGSGIHAVYGEAAVKFMVDPTCSLCLAIGIYSLNHDYRTGGVGYAYNGKAWVFQSDSLYNYTTDMEGLALTHAVDSPYWAASDAAMFYNRVYNDFDDPTTAACVTTNQDAANQSTHNWALSSGLLAAGTNNSTHAQLPATDPHYSTVDYYKNTVIMLQNGGASNYVNNTYGLITGQSSSGVLTVAGWTVGSVTPALDNIVSATYLSGLTCTGTTGQTAGIHLGSGYGTVALTGTNTIASGTPMFIAIPGSGNVTPPTSGGLVGAWGSASCTGTATFTTTVGTAYTIFDTIVTTSASSGAAATVTFTKTSSLAGAINPGDGIMGYNGWGGNFTVGTNMSYVSSVGSNTLSVINGSSVTASSTPTMAWRLPQWTANDCGRIVATKSQVSNSIGVQPAVYGPGVAGSVSNSGFILDALANGGGSSPPAWMVFELETAPNDPRAVRDLVRNQGQLFDYGVRPLIDFSTGRLRDGPGYSMDGDGVTADLFIWALTQSIPSYPLLDATGPWAQNQAVWDMFETLPDLQGGIPSLMGWGGHGAQAYTMTPGGVTIYGLALNSANEFAPLSAATARFRNWQERIDPGGTLWAAPESDRMALGFLHNDPRIPSSDYTVMPHQFAFNTSGSADVTALTGWPAEYLGNAVFSRTGWSSVNDTLTLFDASTFTSGVYDSPRVGQTAIWKTGCLMGADTNPCNGFYAADPSTLSDTFGFAGAGLAQFNTGVPPLLGRTTMTWAAANAGSYGAQYGDNASRYAAACVDATPNYNQSALNLSVNHVQVCWADFKKSGNDQFIFQQHDASLNSGTAAMAWHLQFPQNGQTQRGTVNMPTGSTVSLGGNKIKSLQDGLGSPARTHGLITYVTSPGTITLNDDCVSHGGGQCAPGDTYSGGNGYTHRFTVAGGSSVGALVSSFSSVAVSKIMSSLSDTTLTTSDLNPDSNFTGVQACGAISCAVYLRARGGKTYSSIAGFTTSHTGTAQYLIGGLTAGTYAVTVNSSPVTGSPFTVGTGDNSLYFESTAGAVAVSQTGVAPVIATSSLPTSTAGVGYSQTLAATGGATPYTWSVSSGSLPHYLSINSSTGVISGTPDTAATSFFTVTVTGADTLSASAPLSIVINPAVSVTTTTLPAGGLGASYSQTLAATGGTGADTWSIAAGALPGGLSFNSGAGVISGIPTATGTFNFTVLATDTVGASGSMAISIAVQRPVGVTMHGVTLRRVTEH